MNSPSATDGYFCSGPSEYSDFSHWFQVRIYNIEEWDGWAQDSQSLESIFKNACISTVMKEHGGDDLSDRTPM